MVGRLKNPFLSTQTEFGVFPACLVVEAVEGVVVWLEQSVVTEELSLFHSDQSQATQSCKHGHMTQTAANFHKAAAAVVVRLKAERSDTLHPFPIMHLHQSRLPVNRLICQTPAVWFRDVYYTCDS